MTHKRIAGLTLGVDCAGDGVPAMVFVHGGGCSRHDWTAQLTTLAPQFRVVTFDLPGHGESDGAPDASVEGLARIVCEVTKCMVPGKAILVGHSVGCRLVLEAARQSPQDIAGIVLVEGGRLANGDAEAAVRSARRRIEDIGINAFLYNSFRQMFVTGADQALAQRIIERSQSWDRGMAEALLLSMLRWDAEEAEQVLAEMKMPVLLLQSTYLDESFTRKSLETDMTTPWIEFVMKHTPQAQVQVIPDVGHFVQIETAEMVCEGLAKFAGEFTS